MSRSVNRLPSARVASDKSKHTRKGNDLRKEATDLQKNDDGSEASADLLERHWLLVRELTALCGSIEHAGADVDRTLTSGLKTLARTVPRATSLAFHRKGDGFIEMRGDARRECRQIESAEFLTFLTRSQAVKGAPTEMVRTVSADDFACFQRFKQGHRDGLIALLGQANDPKALLFLWPKHTLRQEDEDVFTVVASCMGSAVAVAEKRDAESRRALAQKDADAAKMEVRAWRDMATKIAHLTSTPLVLAECDLRDLLEKRCQGAVDTVRKAQRHIDEARQALDRAFLFENAAETVVRDWFDLNPVAWKAFAGLGMECPCNETEKVQVYGNDFRVWFAVRDLLVCAQTICKFGSKIRYEARIGKGLWLLRVGIPVVVSDDFDAKCLFSPQCYVASRESPRANWPLSMSLFLARQLIREIRSGNLDAKLSEDSSMLTIALQCAVRAEAVE